MDTLYRHWLILRMIPRRGRLSTIEIHSRLSSEYGIETTLRTIQRDLNELSRLFPLESDDRRPTGWKWKQDSPAFDIPNMDPVTALTFKLAEKYLAKMVPQGVLAALQPYLLSADRLLKGSESLLARWPDKVRIMSRTLATIPPAVSPEISETVYTSLLEEKRFRALYRNLNGKEKTFEVNPLGMTFVDGITYLIATLNEYTDPILLVLNRILAVEPLDRPVTIPDGFVLDECIAELLTFQVGGTIRLKARFTDRSDVQRLIESPVTEEQKVKARPDGSFELTATLEDTLQLRWWLRGYGETVEVLAPKGLRQEFVEMAGKCALLYGSGGS